MLLPRRLDVNVQAEQAKSAEAPFANVDGGSETTTACFSRLLLLSLALQRRAGADLSTTDNGHVERVREAWSAKQNCAQ
ncbi:MAG: hypothetical protein J7M16_11240 [Anaerolineae bacterium]|nr:hypothetical protein [Anaerolineae bacterium]